MRFNRIIILVFSALICLDGRAQSTDGMSIVFSDNFKNNKNGWFTSMSGSNRSRVNNNMEFLIVGVNDKGSSERSWVNTNVDFNKNFVLKAKIKSETDGGVNADIKFGLLVGMSDYKYRTEQGWYGYRLFSNEKKAWIYATNENGTQLFKREVEKPGSYRADDYNEIAIQKKGETVTFYLNGDEVYSNDATSASAGSIIFEAKNVQKAYLNKLEIYQ
ncbi:MAG: hypothetical protein GY816_14860 [Cytophagales bacterium]|nr:hypothetical protein [Cytophagales bacterium]